MSKTFYITTPIYYPSGKLHIGNSYTTVLCDTMARYKKMRGFDTWYLTGMDEHGQKVETVANERGISPQEHVDYIADETKKLWDVLDIEYDDFIRTTEERHETVVAQIFDTLLKQGDIYLGHYEGYYCIHDESFFTETQLEEGHICPDCGRKTKLVKEESYFLKLSKYQDWLLDYIDEHPDFITPESRKNEVVRFIESGLQDLSVSRTSFDWGVSVKSNPEHVIYVWIDALSNYITALGYGSDNDDKFQKYWHGDEVVHVVGKDILRFHAIYWPIMLKALGIDVTFKLYAHGWYMMKDGKMSKSKGKVVYPNQLIERYGLDPVRYYLLREIPYSGDGVFTPEDFVARINYDLANDFGNLVNRTITMINKYFDSKLTKPTKSFFEVDADLKAMIAQTIQSYEQSMEKLDISDAIKTVWTLVSRTNKYIDETEPWILSRDEEKQAALNGCLYTLVESIRIIGILLKPILLKASDALFEQLNIDDNYQTWESLAFGQLTDVHVTDKPVPIFPRLDQAEEETYIKNMLTPPKKQPVAPKEKNTKTKQQVDYATIEDFTKLDIVVGKVVSSKPHPNADRLLVSQIDTGDRVRQIVSGIKPYYSAEEFTGKKVVVIKNLKPVKLRGELSEGMILAGKNKQLLEVLTVNELDKGDKIS